MVEVFSHYATENLAKLPFFACGSTGKGFVYLRNSYHWNQALLSIEVSQIERNN